MKTCNACGETKPLEGFYRNPPHAKGYRPRCKACTLARCREYQSRPEVAERRREAEKRRPRVRPAPPKGYERHGLSAEQFEALLASQGGGCRVCRSSEPVGRGWAVDHDHACCPGIRGCAKCIRGILCTRCNVMLGMALDNPEALRVGVEYLERGYFPLLAQALGAPV